MDATLADMLGRAAPGDIALVPADAPAMTYGGLLDNVESLARDLASRGAGPGERIGLLLPNGPGMAVAFLACATWFSAAPLNPKLLASEVAAIVADLGLRRVVIPAGSPKPGGVESLEFAHEGGRWRIGGASSAPLPRVTQPGAEALVLQTSGTTARPKTVPLTPLNLLTSARNIAGTLELTAADRALAVMPLFHIHGLVATLLAPLVSGGSIACPPGFDAFRFFDWLEALKPTWYSAVPTMHQLIVQRASGPHPVRSTLRFARSSSAAMPPTTLAAVEAVFGVPLLEAYGMTEAAHQIASNPLPPGTRKPGSVGREGFTGFTVLDSEGNELPWGERGEVAIRGENVTSGYFENPEANAAAFAGDWFRTGDEGYIDFDGYLYLSGRLKELINRGGEKIAPREIEEALLRHPAVREAVAFAVPHETLGEEPAAAIIAASDISAKELRKFLATELSSFKIPRQFVFLDSIPVGPTGKVQRLGMAGRLGLAPPSDR